MTEPHHILTAKYRVVTPMFLSGADQNHAELRLPSFKGALRFWWRALAGERFGNDLQHLREAEDALFGSIRTGASRVSMRIGDKQIKTQEQRKFARDSWQSYIGYGLIDKPEQISRTCIQPNSHFTVQLDYSRCEDAQCRSLRNALIALGLFGGLGSRSRNGWGSITLERLTGIDGLWTAPTDKTALGGEIDRLLSPHAALQVQEWTAVTRSSGYAIGKSKSDSEAAHRWLAEQYRSTIKEIANKSQREAFGLPRKNSGENAGERRAGPILLHVHQPEEAQAIPLALFLPGRFLEKQDEPTGGWREPLRFIKGVRQA